MPPSSTASPTGSKPPTTRRCAELMARSRASRFLEAIGEVANCAGAFRYFAEMARDEAGSRGDHAGRVVPICAGARRLVHIMPFNFLILLMCWTVAASLASGNGASSSRRLPRRCRP